MLFVVMCFSCRPVTRRERQGVDQRRCLVSLSLLRTSNIITTVTTIISIVSMTSNGLWSLLFSCYSYGPGDLSTRSSAAPDSDHNSLLQKICSNGLATFLVWCFLCHVWWMPHWVPRPHLIRITRISCTIFVSKGWVARAYFVDPAALQEEQVESKRWLLSPSRLDATSTVTQPPGGPRRHTYIHKYINT